ncbi:hypothetical protein DFJ77DRAFT_514251 [Powellomyces hirtus]|nr:hypothetical protein DFJ77DRAFT_514251 [Powellomyces hirtus]
MKSGSTVFTVPAVCQNSTLSLRSSPAPTQQQQRQPNAAQLTPPSSPAPFYHADDASCPHCHGSGYEATDAPCLSCFGPPLTRFPTKYDGVGSKGLPSAVLARIASLPAHNPSRAETRIWIDGKLIGTAEKQVPHHDAQSSPKPRWSLRMDWLKPRREAIECFNDDDNIDECSEKLTASTTFQHVVKKTSGSRRSRRRRNARAEVVLAEMALRDFLVKVANAARAL